MDRTNYIKKVYSKFWIKQVKHYGNDEYCKAIITFIKNLKPEKVFELAIGTAEPIAIELKNCGINVYGADISDTLINYVNEKYPDINAFVTDGNYHLNYNSSFDVVYCVRSSWYFPNFLNEINKLSNMVKNGGYLIFDIMNQESKYIKNIFFKSYLKIPMLIIKNFIKIILNNITKKQYNLSKIVPIEIPLKKSEVIKYLNNKGYKYSYYEHNEFIFKNLGVELDNYLNDHKIIFVIKI